MQLGARLCALCLPSRSTWSARLILYEAIHKSRSTLRRLRRCVFVLAPVVAVRKKPNCHFCLLRLRVTTCVVEASG